MQLIDISFLEGIIGDTGKEVKDHPWMLCYNDFHSHNIMLRCASRYTAESSIAIDFEDCNLEDSMWDLCFLGGQSRNGAGTLSFGTYFHSWCRRQTTRSSLYPVRNGALCHLGRFARSIVGAASKGNDGKIKHSSSGLQRRSLAECPALPVQLIYWEGEERGTISSGYVKLTSARLICFVSSTTLKPK